MLVPPTLGRFLCSDPHNVQRRQLHDPIGYADVLKNPCVVRIPVNMLLNSRAVPEKKRQIEFMK